ncbi:hypothetical protein, partial [Bacillus sp. PS06]|uniref:hypothetical protein n=1 Tax=Bacillus sp. PS06 TaxID=2764176 RepID=UPI001CD888BC
EVVLIFYSKIIKAGEILLVVKFHRLFHFRDGFCPSLFFTGGTIYVPILVPGTNMVEMITLACLLCDKQVRCYKR